MKLVANKRSIVIFKLILFLLLVYPPIFLHLDSLPIRIWDESRLAINAYEMHKNGNFLVTHFGGTPDMWNTKPPLMIWLQVFFIKILGVGELAIRLPSAIAAFLTCLTIMFFSVKYLKDYWFGLIAVLILVTSHGYINFHATRTGDYDSLLTFFTTAFCISFFLFLETNSKKYLHLFFIALTLAVLTKSAQGLFFLPALFIYILLKNKFTSLVKNKWMWVDLLTSIIIITGYYLLRETYNPGYLQAVWDNELGGRYAQTNEGHEQGVWYYYQNFIAFQFSLWYWLIPCGIVLGSTLKNQQIGSITLFSTIMGISYLLIASSAETKLEWYDVPLYPFLAVIGAVVIYWLFSFFRNSNYVIQQFKTNTAPYVFLFFVFLTPYKKIIDKVYLPHEDGRDKKIYFISSYLQNAVREEHSVNQQLLCYNGYNTHFLFYVNILKDKGQQINFADWHSLSPGDIAIASQKEVKEYIENNYTYELVHGHYNIMTYNITGIKPHES